MTKIPLYDMSPSEGQFNEWLIKERQIEVVSECLEILVGPVCELLGPLSPRRLLLPSRLPASKDHAIAGAND